MEIKPIMSNVSGTFDTASGLIKCVHYSKYSEALLCFSGESANIPFAKIKLYDDDRLVSAQSTYADACALGDEIAFRWALAANAGAAAEAVAQWADAELAAGRLTSEQKSALAGLLGWPRLVATS